jgi:TldD protein
LKELMLRALDLAKLRGARYADIRVIESLNEAISVKNSIVESLGLDESTGFGVRVLVGDGWGFASSREITAEEIDRVTDLAVQIAKASTLLSGAPVDLGPAVASQGTYTTPVKIGRSSAR